MVSLNYLLGRPLIASDFLKRTVTLLETKCCCFRIDENVVLGYQEKVSYYFRKSNTKVFLSGNSKVRKNVGKGQVRVRMTEQITRIWLSQTLTYRVGKALQMA